MIVVVGVTMLVNVVDGLDDGWLDVDLEVEAGMMISLVVVATFHLLDILLPLSRLLDKHAQCDSQ